jgi:hypothetical protein
MHFGENQLSRSLIGLSPLTTGHPPGFQPWWVRASTPSYRRFTLPMARSLRFGSRTRDSNALIGLAFATATPHGLTSPHATNSQAHSSKGTPSRPPPNGRTTLRRIVGTRFQELFHSPPGVLFTLPSRYSCTIGHQEVFSLTRWSWQIHTGFHGPRATREQRSQCAACRLRDSHPLRSATRMPFDYTMAFVTALPAGRPEYHVPQPPHATPAGYHTPRFRLDPLSLATTHGITCCFLFHRVLRCFTSPGSLHTPYTFRRG